MSVAAFAARLASFGSSGAANAGATGASRKQRAPATDTAKPTRRSQARAAEAIPVREWISFDRGQPARLLAFDRTLLSVVVALLALGW